MVLTGILDFCISVALITGLIALVYRYMPAKRLEWKPVLWGALVTALLFHAGRWAIALYLGRATQPSAFGAAASFATLLLWLYYSAQISCSARSSPPASAASRTQTAPMNTLSIRELRREDRAQWDALWQGYLDFYRQALASNITELTWNRLADPNDQPYGLVAEDSARLVGFVHYHFHLSTWSAAGYCYLEDLFVDPGYRGKGAGRALIEAVYDAADRRGVSRVYWHTETDNERAQALYNKVATLAPFVQYRRAGLKT